jgi:Oxygenase domain of the 2OGFeDO superfamily
VEQLWEYRARTRRSEDQFRAPDCKDEEHVACDCILGKNPGTEDLGILLEAPTLVRKADNRPLAIYLPGAMSKFTQDEDTFTTLDQMSRQGSTQNRGLASGTVRVTHGTQKRSYSLPILSAIGGAMDTVSVYHYCRLTVWTGEHLAEWENLFPMFTQIASYLEQYVPDRYAAQMTAANATYDEWKIPGTPFTTVTVNNSYATGVHRDKGDLEAGFSTILCARRGPYTGGRLCFPQWGVQVDLKDGDLLLMDAHDYHGNTAITCGCGNHLMAPCKTCGATRITVVTYFRTKLQHCGTADQELAKARDKRELKLG